MKPSKIYGAEYRDANGRSCTFEFKAADYVDAERRLRSIRGNAELLGELKATVKSWVPFKVQAAKLLCFLGNCANRIKGRCRP